jgi:hypothetical protein
MRFPIHSLGTRILAEVAQGLAVFSMTSYPCMVMFMGCLAAVWFSVILVRLQYYCKHIYKLAGELNTYGFYGLV